MPGLPELPIVNNTARQEDGDPKKYTDLWQTHRGPKPAPEPRNTQRPHGHMIRTEEPS